MRNIQIIAKDGELWISATYGTNSFGVRTWEMKSFADMLAGDVSEPGTGRIPFPAPSGPRLGTDPHLHLLAGGEALRDLANRMLVSLGAKPMPYSFERKMSFELSGIDGAAKLATWFLLTQIPMK